MLSNVPPARDWKSEAVPGDRDADHQSTRSRTVGIRKPAPLATTASPASAPVLTADDTNAMRKMAFFAGLAMIFIRMSVTPELLAYATHTNTYVLYLVAPPAFIGVLLTGGLGRAMRARPVWAFVGFVICLLPATVLSSWQGGSAQVFSNYVRTGLPCLFVLAGTVVNWSEIRKVFKMMAAAGFVVLFVVRFLATPDAEGRLTFDVVDSTIGNPNDLAAHVLLLLPFVVYYGFRPGGGTIAKVIVSALAAFSFYSILGTSSRGALVGLAVMAILAFFQASGFQRLMIAVIVPTIAVFLLTVLPAQNIARLATILHPDSGGAAGGISEEAAESGASRRYLLMKSIEFSIQHPVFGVGPGQFASFEGFNSRAQGQHGNWHETHNSYTQISSECGMPALIFLLGGVFGCIGMVAKTRRRALAAGNREIASACGCFMVSWVGYLVTIFFLACGYRFTLPAMTGIGVAIYFAAERELNNTRARLA